MDAREWEEEQIRLDRDWYSGAEEGGLMGDEEHNPLAQYEDLAAIKQAEIAKKQVVRAHSLLPTSCNYLTSPAEESLGQAGAIRESFPTTLKCAHHS